MSVMTEERARILRNHPLRLWRREREMSRARFVKILRDHGIFVTMLTASNWETCRHFPAKENADAIEEIVGADTIAEWRAFHEQWKGSLPDPDPVY